MDKPDKSEPKKEATKSDEAKSVDEKPKTPPVKVPASSELASQLESLHERLDKLDETVDRLRRRTPSVFGRFLSDLAKVILLAAALTIAWQTGWIETFLDWAAGLELGTPRAEE